MKKQKHSYLSSNLHEHDIDIHCPKCKKECILEWVTFKTGTRNLSQSSLAHGYLRFAPKVPVYIERVKGESLLQCINDIKNPIKCKDRSKLEVCKLVEKGFVDI